MISVSPMSIIHVNHIKADCRARFSGIIYISDINARPEDAENHFLTRALAAFSLCAVAKIEDREAANCVTDEPYDDGIDAFYYSSAKHVCYLVQSKWSNAGSGSIDVGSVLKFIQGIRHLLQGSFAALGPKMQKRQHELIDVLGDSSATFVLVIAYTGRAELSADVRKPLDELVEELNEDSDLVSLQTLRQQELHRVVEQRAFGSSVDFDILLHEYGKVSAPFKAYYGHMDVADIAGWAKYGDNLYTRNIRGFKGSTEVNEAILGTLRTLPERFIYFNNGITITCTGLARKPLGSGSRTSGVFECKGVSVVNGAQTVGSILSFLSANSSNPAAAAANAKVMVRITSLENEPIDLSFDITRAVNTQNRIERRDFAALDPNQSRLKSEMLLSFQKDYVFRTGDASPTPENGCTLDEATVGLACSNPDISLALLAKREIGKLYEDIHSAPYTILFNGSTSAQVMWRAVHITRVVDNCLKDMQLSTEGKMRLIAIHFNRFILHLVFRNIGRLDMPDDEWHKLDLDTINRATKDILQKTTDTVVELYPTAYPGSLFKNATKSKSIAVKVNTPPENRKGVSE